MARSAASLALPRYKNGSTREAGWESMSAGGHSVGVVGVRVPAPGDGSNVSSQNSLCLRWNSLWPPAQTEKQKIIVVFSRLTIITCILCVNILVRR